MREDGNACSDDEAMVAMVAVVVVVAADVHTSLVAAVVAGASLLPQIGRRSRMGWCSFFLMLVPILTLIRDLSIFIYAEKIKISR